jgi:hypothetical protein
MTEWFILAGLVTTLALCSLLVGFYAYYCAQRASHNSRAAVASAREEYSAAVGAMQSKLETLTAELRESHRRLPGEPIPGTAKSSMNVSRRSQALRMRRQGDSPERIAESLEMPRQEVDLLLKVNDIVLNSL